MAKLTTSTVLVTGGAGFIGSNLCQKLLDLGAKVICLDNFSTGKRSNLNALNDHPNFTLLEADIRDFEACLNACKNVDYILHQAALGSVPRSIKDPQTTNDVNVSGFLNMLVAAKENQVKRFIYAASSSTYGDASELPKIEDHIGKPLSPYAITKYVNELYADVFQKTYGLENIGLRYFNVFGRHQDPNGAYAAVIPKFVKKLMSHQSPVINGDGSFSRDFTYIDNVIQMNLLAMLTENPEAVNQVYNVAYGGRTNLNELVNILKSELSKFDPEISGISAKYGVERQGDVPHSQASIEKAKKLLGYQPEFSVKEGLAEAVSWYWNNLK
ncbi:UDP-N-acetylglucosamine 4-epimerase [Zunongwangia mangrovi]|uniref:UDP-N-acetylglucosamine 4-epimerase n=1 Tax=Zunongwangia mangrovi TaxID=1334022 RepID=A0A1I1IIJ8_9FLAO|nr:SDR family oxidoreductase [Zunongwangia mangrovi]SFC33050.1 UDP-N-acetylglucosamine 4-epimerase [Zunongwangia mangrovi]